MSALLGPNIIRLRTARGLNQVALAHRLGIPVTTLSNYETGPNRVPEKLVPRLASELEARICDLYDVEEPHPEPFQPTAVDRFTARVSQAWPTLSEPDQELLEVVARAVAAYRAGAKP